ncbi:hypothetical protein HER32_06595 [Hymenobacter sp. BT18]|uniref:SprB repeat-containing protein n=1 Tax=Hymenobacter sp. BT18 TaxID=2835648 RepID=UPI00143EF376|nr:SprB repeat-containing protein [Hymenobacter sp. BT18]QIX60861.1 hypothetical protein HER32_06595 [Hymenobacter sp. BT18]
MARFAELRLAYTAETFITGAPYNSQDYWELTIRGLVVRLRPVSDAAQAGPTADGYNFLVSPGKDFPTVSDWLARLQATANSLKDALLAVHTQLGYAGLVGEVQTSYNQAGGNSAERCQSYVRIKNTRHGADLNFSAATFHTTYWSDAWKFSSYTITNIDPPTITIEQVKCLCFGGVTGSLHPTITGGVPPYAPIWNDGITQLERTNLPAGEYELLVQDNDAAGIIFENTEWGALTTNFTGETRMRVTLGQNTRVQVLIAATGTDVTLTATGGVGPYTYLWPDGSTLASRSGLAAGLYSVKITDALGCETTIEVRVQVSQLFFSRNPITLPLDAGDVYRANPAIKPNLSFICQVWLQDEAGEFALVGGELEQPAAQGRTTFQVQELLDPYLSAHVPAVGLAAFERASALFRRFYLQYAERYGDSPATGDITTLQEHTVLLGGLDFYEARTRTWFNSYQVGALAPFLTWQPNPRLVTLEQPEFLYALVPRELDNVQLRVLVHFDDGHFEERTVFTATDWKRHEVYCVPVGAQALGLQDEATRRLTKWTVWLSTEPDGDDPVTLTEFRDYLVDRRPPEHPRRYMLYQNSLGGMNTLAITGELQYEVEVSGEEAQLGLAADYDPLQGDVAVLDRELRPMLKFDTGLLPAADRLHLQEMLLSRRILFLHGGRWMPVVCKPKTVQLLVDGKARGVLELEFYLPRQRQFTPLLPVTAVGVLPTRVSDDYSPQLP